LLPPCTKARGFLRRDFRANFEAFAAIAWTTNRKGLKVACVLDTAKYPAGVKVSDAEMNRLNLMRHEFHGEWNYTLLPMQGPKL